jgi:hypothetical protein
MKGNPMADKLDFKEMLSYMRPQGSKHQKKFCNRYLRPVFGNPDIHGNYTKVIGEKPTIAFMAHHDTVHRESGRSNVVLQNGFYTVEGANCLGADCTTGIYILLKMIEAGIPGVYVAHAAEESGCIGSRALVKGHPDWLDHVKIAISFDRKGYSSVITHQMGVRTCSDEFADSLAEALNFHYEKDQNGVYTDSNEYIDIIPECTNISVGYFNQHTSKESQDKVFLDMLVEKVLAVDWSKLVVARDPKDYEDLYANYTAKKYSRFGPRGWEDWDDYYEQQVETKTDTISAMAEIIRNNPVAIANILKDLGYDAYDLHDEVEDYRANIKPSRGFS